MANMKLYHERRKAGVCTSCGKPPFKEGAQLCEYHREKSLKARKKAENKKEELGLCVKCNKPKAQGRFCIEHAKIASERSKAYRAKRKTEGLCPQCGKNKTKKGRNCKKCRDRSSHYWKSYRDKILAHYGAECSCCGITEDVFLTIDHIEGDGAKERKEKKGSGNIMRQIIKDGFPERYQILCWNCNSAKHLLGECPHKTKKTKKQKNE